jgi:hypothetical protein
VPVLPEELPLLPPHAHNRKIAATTPRMEAPRTREAWAWTTAAARAARFRGALAFASIEVVSTRTRIERAHF